MYVILDFSRYPWICWNFNQSRAHGPHLSYMSGLTGIVDFQHKERIVKVLKEPKKNKSASLYNFLICFFSMQK